MTQTPDHTLTPHTTRVRAMTAYAVLLVAWSLVVGIPNDTLGVIVFLWLGTIAWNIGAPRRDHLQFWKDWWPFVLALVAYWLGRGLADEIGVPVHYRMPIRFDEWLTGGRTPTEILQAHWCGTPCVKATSPRWYDTALTTVYASHFLASLTIAAVLWVRNHTEWLMWMRRFVAMNFLGLAIYVAYPMAPPWMASRDGLLGPVVRLTSRGWSEIPLHRQSLLLGGVSNQVAAMPSLHCGFTCLIAFYAVTRLRTRWRFLVLLYPVAMGTALVYFGEHYVVDCLAGALVAALTLVLVSLWERRTGRGRSGQRPAALRSTV